MRLVCFYLFIIIYLKFCKGKYHPLSRRLSPEPEISGQEEAGHSYTYSAAPWIMPPWRHVSQLTQAMQGGKPVPPAGWTLILGIEVLLPPTF